MRQRAIATLAGAALALSGLAVVTTAASATPQPAQAAQQAKEIQGSDDLAGPAEQKREQLRQTALSGVAKGTITTEQRNGSTVAKVGKKPAAKSTSKLAAAGQVDQYVELAREKTDKIFVVLVEFGNQRDPNYPDQDTDPNTPGPARFDGPLHNQIPQPNRAVDNSTNWNADYNRQHYQDLYFSTNPNTDSLANFYAKQSSGRYSVNGEVTDWVKVNYNEARYGRSNGYPCSGIVCSNSEDLVRDGVNAWFNSQVAQGRTPAAVSAELATFDQWDRYDYDGDGNFNEPDGYIDHFQIVHAGGDQADGDPIFGEDAIWSHRGYAYSSTASGPANNQLGGTQVGSSGIWVGDYTMQPENGGISVFAHEYGHDLGLPDLYDTSGGGQNNINWWSLMAQNRVSKLDEPIGFRANDMDSWSKLQLGWLDYEVVVAGQTRTLTLGPAEYNSAKAQGVVVVLPDKVVTNQYGAPFAGTKQWWSGKGNNLSNSLTRPIDLTGHTTGSVSLKARYDTEMDFDYVYIQASSDGGAHWSTLDGTVNGQPFVHDSSGAPALNGSTNGAWVDVNVPLNSQAGHPIQFRFLYKTDGSAGGIGFFADNIVVTVDGTQVLNDGAESGNNGWTPVGFKTTTGTETQSFDNFYIASNRTYQSYDQYMQTGPYNFGFPDKPQFVEHFPYQTGLLVWYWDTSVTDNNTSEHNGHGLVLPIDSHPDPIYNLEGRVWRERIAAYDAPFSTTKADSFTLHINGKASYIRGQAAVSLFDDTKTFWFAAQPNAGVFLPATGTTIKVQSQDGTSMKIKVSHK